MVGVEPTSREAHEPESCVSTSSTTSAKIIFWLSYGSKAIVSPFFRKTYFCSIALFYFLYRPLVGKKANKAI